MAQFVHVPFQAMGDYGAKAIAETVARQAQGKSKVNILTHCNTGSLATAGFGTALGVVRALQAHGKLGQVFCTETRPYNQGGGPCQLLAFLSLHFGD